MFKSSQRGFTLIELVVVIVILGILAAFAIPRFARLDQQARIASLRAVEGSLRSSSALAHSVWLAAGNNPANVAMDNVNIAIINGYPTRVSIVNTLAPGTVVANTAGRYTTTNINANAVEFRLTGATNPAACLVRYTETANANVPPAILVVGNPADC